MPPAINRCEYAREKFIVQALATGWCATGHTVVEERSPGTRSGFAPPNQRRRRGLLQDRLSSA
jgi:hypothetical protein